MMFSIAPLFLSNIVLFKFSLYMGGGGWKEKHDKASFYFGDGNMFRLHFNSRECQMFPKTVPFEKLKKLL